jgi:hypothetical protein
MFMIVQKVGEKLVYIGHTKPTTHTRYFTARRLEVYSSAFNFFWRVAKQRTVSITIVMSTGGVWGWQVGRPPQAPLLGRPRASGLRSSLWVRQAYIPIEIPILWPHAVIVGPRLRVLLTPPLVMSVRMELLGPHWTDFHESKHFSKVYRENSNFIKICQE